MTKRRKNNKESLLATESVDECVCPPDAGEADVPSEPAPEEPLPADPVPSEPEPAPAPEEPAEPAPAPDPAAPDVDPGVPSELPSEEPPVPPVTPPTEQPPEPNAPEPTEPEVDEADTEAAVVDEADTEAAVVEAVKATDRALADEREARKAVARGTRRKGWRDDHAAVKGVDHDTPVLVNGSLVQGTRAKQVRNALMKAGR